MKATMRTLLRPTTFEVRRHTLISVGQRGRGRHLLSEGLSPKVGRTGGPQLEAPFSRIPPPLEELHHHRHQGTFSELL